MRSALPRKASVLHARYVNNPSSRSIFDWTSRRADVNRMRFKSSIRANLFSVEKVVTARMA